MRHTKMSPPLADHNPTRFQPVRETASRRVRRCASSKSFDDSGRCRQHVVFLHPPSPDLSGVGLCAPGYSSADDVVLLLFPARGWVLLHAALARSTAVCMYRTAAGRVSQASGFSWRTLLLTSYPRVSNSAGIVPSLRC